MKKCSILGVNINVTNMKNALSEIEENLNSIKGCYICVSNVHTTIMAYENNLYRHVQNDAYMALPDGKPLSVVSRLKGYKDAARVTGPDLMEEIFKTSAKKGYKHYFYGSTFDVLLSLKNKLEEDYPGIQIVGTYSPPFRELTEIEDVEVINSINSSQADFLWVGLGAPKQELWMNKHKDKINSLMIGVGAGFDYHSGALKRAPQWMQRFSLEWLYRLMQEPRRLFKRYATTNLKFIYLVIKSFIAGENFNSQNY